MEQSKLYEDIALRTDGDIYIGVVGPVRTGKSTFIKRFMETMVIPNIDNVYRKERARDELPQSGSGRTVMTAEPKFVPEEAVSIELENGASFSVRLIDCVGYLVPGAAGAMEDDAPRMVTTPWFDYEIPMTDAAEIGTRKVIAEHSTIGIVVTTDGTITDIPREDYLEAEERVIQELKELGKPFLVVLNSAYPDSDRAKAIRADLASRYDVTVVCADCLQLDEGAVTDIIKGVLYEFPVKELDLFLPPWVDALPQEHPIKAALYASIREGTGELRRIRDVEGAVASFQRCEEVSGARVTAIDLGTGVSSAVLELPRRLTGGDVHRQIHPQQHLPGVQGPGLRLPEPRTGQDRPRLGQTGRLRLTGKRQPHLHPPQTARPLWLVQQDGPHHAGDLGRALPGLFAAEGGLPIYIHNAGDVGAGVGDNALQGLLLT